MHTDFAFPLKSTIVRLLSIALAGLFLAACTGVAPRTAQRAPCAAAGTLICEDFGAESRCGCTDAAAVERQVAGLGELNGTTRGW